MFDPEQFMKWVTRENAALMLASLDSEDRAHFEWWFVMRYGDRIPRREDRGIYIGSHCGEGTARSGTVPETDIESAYGAMHRAILASREPF